MTREELPENICMLSFKNKGLEKYGSFFINNKRIKNIIYKYEKNKHYQMNNMMIFF